MDDATAFTIPSVYAPRSLASLSAASESAVSPDCEIIITASFLPRMGFLYLNSDASSASHGRRASFSVIYFPKSPACIAVPQATINIFSAWESLLDISFPSPEKSGMPFFILPRRTSDSARGSSCISLSIKCGYPHFSAELVSHVDTLGSLLTSRSSLS